MTKDIRLNARIDADLRRKLQELSDTLGINQSAVLTVAINRLHQQEIVPMTAQTQTAITIDNPTRTRKWGWGYSTTPTGRDAWSIETPTSPDYTGTLKQIYAAIHDDRTYQSLRSGGTFVATAWFYDGRRIANRQEFDAWLQDIDLDIMVDGKVRPVALELDNDTDDEPITDMETFATRTQAKAAIAKMQGWDAKAVKYCFATVGGGTVDAWVIECDGNKYLREDGFVR